MKKLWSWLGLSSSVPSTVEYLGVNSVLADYLRYYVTLTSPGYAVLVTGPWGVGKTYQVKQVIAESERYYVSLYGLETVASIHDAVIASALPGMKLSGPLAAVGDVGKSMGDKFALAGLASGIWTAVLKHNLKPDRTIVFDDLERSSLWADNRSALLGTINQYAEHLGFRVVVICNDERIVDQLAELREKTFGHTVKAMPQRGAALEIFLRDVEDEGARAFVTDHRSLIEDIWEQSGQSSLRILKHLINDVSRLRKALTARHLENLEMIEHVLCFFCALDIEVRAGNLSDKLLRGRMERHVGEGMRRDLPDQQKPLKSIISRYPSSDLTGTILSDEIIVSALVDGRFDSESIEAWLDQTPYFIRASEADPWRIVIRFDEVEDSLLDEGIVRMQRQFDERSVTNMGEFLHIVALRLLMAEYRVSGRSFGEEVQLCVNYIDELRATRRVPATSLVVQPADRLYQGHDGFGYYVTEAAKPHFDVVSAHVKDACQEALVASYPDHARDVLRRLKEDPTSLFQMISITNSGGGALATVPIMVHILPKAFLDAWLSGARNGWRKVSLALENRYAFNHLQGKLRDEREWLVALRKEFDERTVAESGFSKLRLIRIRPEFFDGISLEEQPS